LPAEIFLRAIGRGIIDHNDAKIRPGEFATRLHACLRIPPTIPVEDNNENLGKLAHFNFLTRLLYPPQFFLAFPMVQAADPASKSPKIRRIIKGFVS
jgi:hypothetical protein